jgi:hypothetical protein
MTSIAELGTLEKKHIHSFREICPFLKQIQWVIETFDIADELTPNSDSLICSLPH